MAQTPPGGSQEFDAGLQTLPAAHAPAGPQIAAQRSLAQVSPLPQPPSPTQGSAGGWQIPLVELQTNPVSQPPSVKHGNGLLQTLLRQY